MENTAPNKRGKAVEKQQRKKCSSPPADIGKIKEGTLPFLWGQLEMLLSELLGSWNFRGLCPRERDEEKIGMWGAPLKRGQLEM
jgi:hypothetical protein